MTKQQLQNELARAQAEITHLKQSQQTNPAFDESTFRSILDASPVPQVLCDQQQNILYINPAFIDTFGYDLNEVASLTDWSRLAYPDPLYRQQVSKDWQQRMQESLLQNKPFDPVEVRVHCKTGDEKIVIAGASYLHGTSEGLHLITIYNVSKIKKIEDRLNQTVSLLENVINSTPDLIAVKNKNLQTILCNDAYAHAVGKQREDMYGKTDIENGWDPELVNGNPQKGIRGFIHDDMDALSGINIHNPFDPANVDGEVRIFDTHKLPLKNSDCQTIGVLLIARDVTERNNSQTKLQESEHRFRSIIESIENIAVQGYDQNHRVIFWNPASTALYGYSEEEALGQKLEDLIIPEPMKQAVFAGVEQWIHNGISIPASEIILKNKQGGNVPVYSSHTILRSADGTAELYCLDVSISELQQAQSDLERVNSELDATLRAIPDLLFELNESGEYINVWARDEKLLAAEKNSLLGHTVNEKLPEDAAGIVMHALHEASETGYSHGQIISLVLPTGKLWFELSVAAKPDKNGKKTFIVLSRDITERVSTEEQLRRSQKMDALGKLTGGIAHDFNNMLGVIIGYSDLLQEKTDANSPSRNYVEQIITAANRARTLTSKLLAFSRKQPIEMHEWNINEILLHDRHMLEKALTAKVELIFNQDNNLHMVCIDRDTFSDTILNLCINAMHAMPDGGHLTITTKNITLTEIYAQTLDIKPGEYIQISIADTGTGITPEIKEKIFEPFFTTKDSQGTGLGLSQVYGFVKQSKGDIQVYSEPEKGSQFVIHLPRLKSVPSAKTHPVENPETRQNNQHETILIVDDEPALRELTGEVLEQCGYHILHAKDANAALKILTEQAVDLMLTDVIMPGMNGYQLAKQVSKKYPEIKIIIASGYNDEANTHDIKNLSYLYLDKPFHSDVLLKAIHKLLN